MVGWCESAVHLRVFIASRAVLQRDPSGYLDCGGTNASGIKTGFVHTYFFGSQ